MSSAVSLPNHTFTGQALSSKRLTSIVHILSPETNGHNDVIYFLLKNQKKKKKIKMSTETVISALRVKSLIQFMKMPTYFGAKISGVNKRLSS